MKSLITLSLIFLSSITLAVAAEPGKRTITLEQAIVRVLVHHPQLKIADYDARAIAARIKIAGLKPADSIKLEMEDLGGTGDARLFTGVEATLSLARVLELGNKSTYRADVVKQESYVLRDKQDAERLDLLAATARRFLQVVFDQERISLANVALKLARQTEEAVEKRIRAARSPIAERHRVAIDIARSELELEHAEHELASSRVMLSSMWNNTDPDFGKASADIFKLDAVSAIEDYKQLLDRNPDLIRLATRQRLADARIRLAQVKRKPDIVISGGIRYLGTSDDVGFVLSANIPFGTSQRAAPAIEEAEFLGMIDPLAFEQKRTELYVTLYAIYQELSHSRIAIDLLQQRIIPSAQNALKDYENLYSTGRYSLLELVEVQRTLLNSRMQLLESAADFHRYRIEIDRLTGAPVTTGGTP